MQRRPAPSGQDGEQPADRGQRDQAVFDLVKQRPRHEPRQPLHQRHLHHLDMLDFGDSGAEHRGIGQCHPDPERQPAGQRDQRRAVPVPQRQR